MKGRVEMFSDKIPFILFFTYVSDIPKKKDSSPSKKKDQSPSKKKVSSKDKKSAKKKHKYSQTSLLVHFAILGLYALCGILVKGNVFIVSIMTGFLGVYVYWFAI